MKVEIEQPDRQGWKDWLVVEKTEEHVSITREYQKPGSKERRVWHDEGIDIRLVDLPKMLEVLGAMVTGGTER